MEEKFAPLLKRAFMFLEDGEFDKAAEYCEKVLDMDPENVEAYRGKLMADLKACKFSDLKNQPDPFDDNRNYQKIVRFADESLKAELQEYIEYIVSRNKQAKTEKTYIEALSKLKTAKTESEFNYVAFIFEGLMPYKDSAERRAECLEKAEIAKKESQIAREKQKKITIIFVAIGIVLALVITGAIMISGANNKENIRNQLIGKTFTGTYTYSDITEDTYRITFINEKYCNIEYCFTTSGYFVPSKYENGEFVYDEFVPGYYDEGKCENVPYELTGIRKIKFNWESTDAVYHSVEPFEININGDEITLYTSNFNSHTELTLDEE